MDCICTQNRGTLSGDCAAGMMGSLTSLPANLDVSMPPKTMTPSCASLLPNARVYALTLVAFCARSWSTKLRYFVPYPFPYPIPKIPEKASSDAVATPNWTPWSAIGLPASVTVSVK